MNIAEILALFFAIDATVFCDTWNSWFGSDIKPESEAREVFGKTNRFVMLFMFMMLFICEWCPYLRRKLFHERSKVLEATVNGSLGPYLNYPRDIIQVSWMLNYAKRHGLKEFEQDGFIVCSDDKGVWYHRYEGSNWQKYSVSDIAKQLHPNPDFVEAEYESIKDELMEDKIVIEKDIVFTTFGKNSPVFYSLRGPHIRSRGPEPKAEYISALEALYFQAMESPNNEASADGFRVYLDKHHNWVHTIPDTATISNTPTVITQEGFTSI